MQRRPVQLWCDEFPVLSETFVATEAEQLAALGHDVRVVSVADLRREGSLLAALRVACRHPVAVVRDRRDRRRWRREEVPRRLRELAPAIERLAADPAAICHAHFAAGAALDAMRASRILGRPWSLTAHAYDIYAVPRNLPEKLRSASVVTSGCEYTVRDLRAWGGGDHVHKIVMGVDPERFSRHTSHPERGLVVAVGRLVEKKGFVHLIRAARGLDHVVIVGEGPARPRLEAEIARLGAGSRVELAGALPPDQVRALLERAAVLAAPCIVAADGDRDSMPVVVKEALAMEVPVVATDEVGLPEIIRPAFGRLVPPGDEVALAAALGELLALDPAARAAMGRSGREFVCRHANVRCETAKLSALFQALP